MEGLDMSKTTERLVENSMLTLAARVMVLVVSTVALPFGSWTLYSLQQSLVSIQVLITDIAYIKQQNIRLEARIDKLEDRIYQGWSPGHMNLWDEDKIEWLPLDR